MKLRELILHIGFGKTGSSALQSWLAINSGYLGGLNVSYAGFSEAARNYDVTSGNAELLMRYLRGEVDDSHFVADSYFGTCDRAIVSNEMLQALRSDDPLFNRLRLLCEEQDIRLKFVAFIRHVYGHFYSNYVQAVKRAGFTGEFGDWISDKLEFRPAESYKSLSADHDFELLSYEASANDLASSFCRAVSIDYQSLPKIESRRVNRTLNRPEIDFLREVVSVAGELGLDKANTARFISDSLVFSYPSTSSSHLVDIAVLEDVKLHLSEPIQDFNDICFPRFGFGVEILGPNLQEEYGEKQGILFSSIIAKKRVFDILRRCKKYKPLIQALVKRSNSADVRLSNTLSALFVK